MIYCGFLVTDPCFDLRFSLRYLYPRVCGKNQKHKLRGFQDVPHGAIAVIILTLKKLFIVVYRIKFSAPRIAFHIYIKNCNRNKLLLYIITIYFFEIIGYHEVTYTGN